MVVVVLDASYWHCERDAAACMTHAAQYTVSGGGSSSGSGDGGGDGGNSVLLCVLARARKYTDKRTCLRANRIEWRTICEEL